MQTDVQPAGDSLLANTPSSDESISVASTAPGQLRVIKRNGAVVNYDESKISVAITKAYLAVEGGNAAASSLVPVFSAKEVLLNMIKINIIRISFFIIFSFSFN